MPEIFRSQSPNHSNGQINAPSATSTETHANGEARQSAEAVMQRNRVAGEALRQQAYATAEVTRQSTQASLEAIRRAGETANEAVRPTMQVMVEGQRQIVREATETFQEVNRKMAQAVQGTSEEVRRLAMLPQATEGGLYDLQQSIASLVGAAMHANLRAVQKLFRLANPGPIIELQQRCAREYLDAVMQGTATVARAVRRTADEILHPLEVHIERHQAARQGYRTAAQ